MSTGCALHIVWVDHLLKVSLSFLVQRGFWSSVDKKSILKVDGKCDRKMADLIVKQHLNSENSNDKSLKTTQDNINGTEAIKTPAKPQVNILTFLFWFYPLNRPWRYDVLHFLFNKMYSLCSSHPKQGGRGMIYFGAISFIWLICMRPEHMDCIWQ